jgi:hypothetical protein
MWDCGGHGGRRVRPAPGGPLELGAEGRSAGAGAARGAAIEHPWVERNLNANFTLACHSPA